jgi:cytochrome c biogenesis protein ResB
MPRHEEFQMLHTQPLFGWMAENKFSITWWLWGAIGILSILTANTIFCSIDSIIRRREAKGLLLIISPQVIHIGFLFILLAHLMSSYGSYRENVFAYKNTILPLPNGLNVLFEEIRTDIAPSGHIRNWSADITYFREGKVVSSDVIEPNNPSFNEGLGIYIKTVRMSYVPVVLVEVSRDPGAVWALVGGVLFMSGMITLLILKIRREEVSSKE